MGEDTPGIAPGTVPGASGDSPGEWVGIAEAARRLGVTPKAIRNRIKHNTIEWRSAGNRGREVLVADDMEDEAGDSPGDSPGTLELMVRVARLEERLAASERREADLRAERDRLAAELTEARKPVLVRLLEALRRQAR